MSVTFSANCGFTIFDLALMRRSVHDLDTTLERALRGHLADAVANADFAVSKRERKKLCTAAKATLKKEAAEWGVTVENVRLTDFVRADQRRLFQDFAQMNSFEKVG